MKKHYEILTLEKIYTVIYFMSLTLALNLVQAQLEATRSHPCYTSDLTIFCDFDGPLVDVSDRYYHTYQLALADTLTYYQTECPDLQLTCLSKDEFWQMKRDRTPDVNIALRSGLEQKQIQYFMSQVQRIVNQPALLHQDCLQPDVHWALNLLHAQGAQLILVTLRCQKQAIEILRSYGLLQLFTDIRGTENFEAAYQNSSQHKTQLLSDILTGRPWDGVCPQVAWMIGDTEADILAGQAVGISTIALTCGIRSQTYLEQYKPTCIHSSLLAAAEYLVQADHHSEHHSE